MGLHRDPPPEIGETYYVPPVPHLMAGEPNPALYPNLHAILAGCVSGSTSEWPAIRSELRRLCAAFYELPSHGGSEHMEGPSV